MMSSIAFNVTADDDYHWVCEQCFADFRDRFNWTVVPSA